MEVETKGGLSPYDIKAGEVSALRNEMADFLMAYTRESVITVLKHEAQELDQAGLLGIRFGPDAYGRDGDSLMEGKTIEIKIMKINQHRHDLNYFLTLEGKIVALPMLFGNLSDPTDVFKTVDNSIYPFLLHDTLKTIIDLYEFETGFEKHENEGFSVHKAKAKELGALNDDMADFLMEYTSKSVIPALEQEAKHLDEAGIFPTEHYGPDAIGSDYDSEKGWVARGIPIKLMKIDQRIVRSQCFLTPEGKIVTLPWEFSQFDDPTDAFMELYEPRYPFLVVPALERISELYEIAAHNERFAKEREKVSA